MGEFIQFSKEIIQEFLFNVSLADDRIEFVSNSLPSVIVSPSRETVASSSVKQEIKVSEKVINVKPILDEFNAKGIPCSFLLLDDTKDPNYYTNLLFKSDAIILDWQINSDAGEYILKVLKIIFEGDNDTLRVILIYTGNPNLREIVKKTIEEFPEISFEVDNTHGCSIRFKSTIVSVYAKSGITVDAGLEGRILNDHQLVESLIDEFLSVTLGLVSNVALKSIAVIRKNTHKLLSVFNAQLDPAFLAHRSLLSNVSESEEQIIDIIGSEIKSLFYSNNVGSVISHEVIRKYLTDFFPEEDIDFLFPTTAGF